MPMSVKALIVDWESLEENFDNDRAAITMVVEAFLNSAMANLEKVRLAIQKNNSKDIALASHSLKGAISNFGALEAVRTAQILENHGYGEIAADVKGLYSQLETQVMALVGELQKEGHRYKD